MLQESDIFYSPISQRDCEEKSVLVLTNEINIISPTLPNVCIEISSKHLVCVTTFLITERLPINT